MNEESNVLAEDVSPQGNEIVEDVNSDISSKENEISDSDSIKKRLGQQKKKHNREIRALQDQIAQMQGILLSQSNQKQSDVQDLGQQIQKPQIDPRHLAEMQKLHDEFNRDLQEVSNKYDDFDDIVRDPYAPFTDSIREIAMTLDNPGEVIYSLGKNRDELYRIKDLPPHRQAKEMHKLSKALSLKDKNALGNMQTKTLTPLKGDGSTIKSSSGTPSVGDFRKMLRSGKK